MKILILICGLKRSINLVLKNIEDKYKEHDYEIIICIENKITQDDINIFNNKILIKKIFLNNISDDSYRNSINYSYKLYNGIKSIDNNNYDLYIVQRSDLIINNINLLDFNDKNLIYFSSKNINQFTKNIYEKINDNIIITKNYNLLKKIENIYDYLLIKNNYLNIALYNYLKENIIEYKLIDIDYKLILSECNIIAIAGDSGSGKTTLMNALKPLFINDEILTLETDRYHKWERGDNNYKKFTHLNPEANYLEKMYEDVYDLKIGNEIYQVDYDHLTGKFTQKEKIESKNNLILCGLHTIYNNKINEITDIKIYIDVSRELIKKWKIQRDVIERGYTLEKVLDQINNREKDYEEFILIQKYSSDIIINFYEDKNNIQCKLVITNKNIVNKIISEIIKLNYNIIIENEKLIIYLKNEFNIENEKIKNIIQLNDNLYKSKYYMEIFYILYIYVNYN